jgi:hypothetical protein
MSWVLPNMKANPLEQGGEFERHFEVHTEGKEKETLPVSKISS